MNDPGPPPTIPPLSFLFSILSPHLSCGLVSVIYDPAHYLAAQIIPRCTIVLTSGTSKSAATWPSVV